MSVCCVGSIQAAWRGYIVRCWYHGLRKTKPPKDPSLRREFYQEKVHFAVILFFRSFAKFLFGDGDWGLIIP